MIKYRAVLLLYLATAGNSHAFVLSIWHFKLEAQADWGFCVVCLHRFIVLYKIAVLSSISGFCWHQLCSSNSIDVDWRKPFSDNVRIICTATRPWATQSDKEETALENLLRDLLIPDATKPWNITRYILRGNCVETWNVFSQKNFAVAKQHRWLLLSTDIPRHSRWSIYSWAKAEIIITRKGHGCTKPE